MQFKDFRPYEPGDDIRHMSWSVTARTGKPTIKVYEQERELDVVLVVDTSSSTLFGNTRKRKLDMYGEIAAIIGLSALGAGDNFGQIIFNDTVTSFLRPNHRPEQVRVALTHLFSTDMEQKRSNLASALNFTSKSLSHRSLVIILSDFWVEDFEAELGMASRRHECILVHGYDQLEMGSGVCDLSEIQDPESGEIYILDGNTQHTKTLLQRAHWSHQLHLEETANRTNSDYLSLSVEDDYVQRLVLFFQRRGFTRL